MDGGGRSHSGCHDSGEGGFQEASRELVRHVPVINRRVLARKMRPTKLAMVPPRHPRAATATPQRRLLAAFILSTTSQACATCDYSLQRPRCREQGLMQYRRAIPIPHRELFWILACHAVFPCYVVKDQCPFHTTHWRLENHCKKTQPCPRNDAAKAPNTPRASPQASKCFPWPVPTQFSILATLHSSCASVAITICCGRQLPVFGVPIAHALAFSVLLVGLKYQTDCIIIP